MTIDRARQILEGTTRSESEMLMLALTIQAGMREAMHQAIDAAQVGEWQPLADLLDLAAANALRETAAKRRVQ